MLPEGARLEAMLAPLVALYDVSALLPRKGPDVRDVAAIRRIYVHHSGALGAAGFKGAQASTAYVMTKRAPKFPCAPYHFWIPFGDLTDPHGNLCVLRLVPDHIVAWHTGGKANRHGLGVCLQGNTTKAALSPSHKECLEALLPWLRARHELGKGAGLDAEWLSWHSDAARFGGKRKAACPGANATAWLEAYRARA
jgi:hypothetical protein